MPPAMLRAWRRCPPEFAATAVLAEAVTVHVAAVRAELGDDYDNPSAPSSTAGATG
jgi:hypothetical protein